MTATFVSPAADPVQRKTGIGGSDAAAICGLDNYRSALAVYYEKTGEITGDTAGEAAHWGNVLEGPVAEEFARRNNVTVVTAPPFVRHRDHDYLFANVDRNIAEWPDDILEVKTTGQYMAANWDDGPPERVQVQALHYLEVAEKVRAHVCVLIGGQRYAQFVVERDDRAIAALLKIEAEFWERVQDRRPPPADGSSSSRDALAAVWPETRSPGVVLPPDAAKWLRLRAEAHEEVKRAQAVKDECDNLLRQAMEDGEEGWLDGAKVVTLKAVAETIVAAYPRKAYRKLNIVKGAF